MSPTIAEVGALAAGLLGSFISVAGLRSWALRVGALDRPNERSSHIVPTPRGGGAGAFIGIAIALGVSGGVSLAVPFPSWAIGAFLLASTVAVMGWVDDRRGLSARMRLVAQIGLAFAWVLYGGWRMSPGPSIDLGSGLRVLWPVTCLLGVVFIVWMTNLHNFMDGVDGLAGVQAVAVALGAAGIAVLEPAGAASDVSMVFVWLAIAAGFTGFLAWNWSPAKIFMGDVGSASIGFLIAALAFRWEADRPGAVALICILSAVFIVDATWTLGARALRRRPLAQAHRSHAYQIAARRWGSHAKVSFAVLAYDALALAPLALASATGRIAPVVAFVLGGAPVALACWWLGAGGEAADPRSPLA